MRIRLRLRSPHPSQDNAKYLILVDGSLSSISELQSHIISTLNLEGCRVQLLQDDCMIPSGESIEILEEMRVYEQRCKVFQHGKGKKEKKQGKEVEHKKKPNKEKRVVREQTESESSESDDGKYQIKKLRKEVAKQQKSAPIKITKSKQAATRMISQDDAIPQRISPQKKQTIIEAPKLGAHKQIEHPAYETIIDIKKSVAHQPTTVTPVASTPKQAKKVIEDSDDSEQQQPKPSKYQIKSAPKSNIPIAVRKQQFKATHKPTQQQPQVTPQIPTKQLASPPQPQLPKPHSQNPPSQWLQLPVKILQQCRKAHLKSFLQIDQNIMYQQTQLDQEKFIPKVSDWKSAEVKSVNRENQELVLVVQPRRDQVTLCEYNLVGLRVKEKGLTEFQNKVVAEVKQAGKKTPERVVQEEKPQNKPPIKPSQVEKQPTNISPPASSPPQQSPYRDIVTSQVDYYFSDKNYNKDNYLISHAGLHPQLYVSANVILNCPKIKRLNITQQQFMRYLKEDTKPNKTYELHPTEPKLRKKGLRIEKPQQNS